jgi:hypothetical protein
LPPTSKSIFRAIETHLQPDKTDACSSFWSIKQMAGSYHPF